MTQSHNCFFITCAKKFSLVPLIDHSPWVFILIWVCVCTLSFLNVAFSLLYKLQLRHICDSSLTHSLPIEYFRYNSSHLCILHRCLLPLFFSPSSQCFFQVWRLKLKIIFINFFNKPARERVNWTEICRYTQYVVYPSFFIHTRVKCFFFCCCIQRWSHLSH
jgi:hypothetical protein